LPDDKRDIDDATRFDPGADLQLRRPLHGPWDSADQKLVRFRRVKDSLKWICVEVSIRCQIWVGQSGRHRSAAR
jgi:hypothetical protein